MVDPSGVVAEDSVARRVVDGVGVTVALGYPSRLGDPSDEECRDFLGWFDRTSDRFRPDVLVSYGGDRLSREIRARAKRRGIAVVFALHNFAYKDRSAFEAVDAVIVPSRLAAEHYRRTLGLDCVVLPNLIDLDRVRVPVEARDPRYVTFVNPSVEKGVYPFARIADELGRVRPEIPILVVEGRGSERTLADCGLDLTRRGNVFLMGHTPDPRQFWGVTRICLMPSLWWENQPLVAIEAMCNGIPVVGSDRGGIPEALGRAGIVLPLSDRLTPQTRELPTLDEVAPWVEAILRLWDDPAAWGKQARLAEVEARRWASEVVEPLHARFFGGIRTLIGGDDRIGGRQGGSSSAKLEDV